MQKQTTYNLTLFVNVVNFSSIFESFAENKQTIVGRQPNSVCDTIRSLKKVFAE